MKKIIFVLIAMFVLPTSIKPAAAAAVSHETQSLLDLQLLDAIGAKDINAVKEILERGANPNVADTDGDTALFLAAAKGNLDIVKLLSEKRADVNAARTTDGATPLIAAAEEGHLNVVEFLIVNHANVDAATINRATALYFAAQNGHFDVVKFLIANHANVDAATINRATPLQIAAENGHLDVVKFLIAVPGINVNAAATNGDTALFVAAFYGYVQVALVLLAVPGINVNAITTEGFTPLFVAAQNGHLSVVQALVNAGVNVNVARTSDGATALYVAAQNGHLPVVQALINAGADMNIARPNGATALLIAAHNGHLSVVQALIAAGADMNIASNNNITALTIALKKNHYDIAKYIFEKHPNLCALSVQQQINIVIESVEQGFLSIIRNLVTECKLDVENVRNNNVNHNDDYLLTLAVDNNHEDIVNYLLSLKKENGTAVINVNAAPVQGDWSPLGRTALILAAFKGESDAIIRALLVAGANVNHQDKFGRSALMYAIDNGNIEAVKIFLESDADVDLKDNLQQTAFHLIRPDSTDENDKKIAQLILDYKASRNVARPAGAAASA